jgi:hypothetical protein
MGSLRSLRHNLLAKKNQVQKPKAFWRGDLARHLAKTVATKFPDVQFATTPHESMVWSTSVYPSALSIQWNSEDASKDKYQEIRRCVAEEVKVFASEKGLTLNLSSVFINVLNIRRGQANGIAEKS